MKLNKLQNSNIDNELLMKMINRYKRVSIGCFVIGCIVICIMAWIVWGYVENDIAYDELVNNAVEITPVDDGSDSGNGLMSIDWNYLKSINEDTVGWIYMPGTIINYPIVQSSDNDYYLHRNFYNRYSSVSVGAIFLDARNSRDFSDDNNVIYGHHMDNGSMFAYISKLANQYNFDTHRDFWIFTPKVTYKCRTFSLVKTYATDNIFTMKFQHKKNYNEYIVNKLQRSVVDSDMDGRLGDSTNKLFSLSTCDYSFRNARAICFGYVDQYLYDEPVLVPDKDI